CKSPYVGRHEVQTHRCRASMDCSWTNVRGRRPLYKRRHVPRVCEGTVRRSEDKSSTLVQASRAPACTQKAVAPHSVHDTCLAARNQKDTNTACRPRRRDCKKASCSLRTGNSQIDKALRPLPH